MSTNAVLTVKYIGGDVAAGTFYMHSNCNLESLIPKLNDILGEPVDIAPSPCKLVPYLIHKLYDGTSRMKMVKDAHTPDSSYIYHITLTCLPVHDTCPQGTLLRHLYNIEVYSGSGSRLEYSGHTNDYKPGESEEDTEDTCGEEHY